MTESIGQSLINSHPDVGLLSKSLKVKDQIRASGDRICVPKRMPLSCFVRWILAALLTLCNFILAAQLPLSSCVLVLKIFWGIPVFEIELKHVPKGSLPG